MNNHLQLANRNGVILVMMQHDASWFNFHTYKIEWIFIKNYKIKFLEVYEVFVDFT